jgi:hypothetical protein
MRKIYTFRRTHGRFTATRVLLVVAALALVTALASHHGVGPGWPRQAAASAPMPFAASAQLGASPRMLPDSTVYFPSQYELHAGPPEPLPATF